MTTMTASQIPALDGFETYYGVPVCFIGEDGLPTALGHHEPRRFLAAVNRYAREVLGWSDYRHGNVRLTVADLLADVRREWMMQTDHCNSDHDYLDPGEDCAECEEIKSYKWYITSARQDAIDAFPVTVLS